MNLSFLFNEWDNIMLFLTYEDQIKECKYIREKR